MMKKYIPMIALVAILSAASAQSAFAESADVTTNLTTPAASVTATANTTTSAKAAARVAASMPKLITRADTQITARINSLNAVSARIAKFKHLTDAQKATLTASVQTSITAMNTLKAKIDADTDLATLKTDVGTITKDYRIFMVVIPSTNTIAAADNALASIIAYQALVTKLQVHADAAAKVSLADATAKLTDAQTQANAMITAVSSLKPDMGNASIQASNKASLAAAKTARAAMRADILAAHKDIVSVRSELKTTNEKAQ